MVRTEKGAQLLRGARETGYVTAERAAPDILNLSQKEMPIKRGAVWGRLLTMRAFLIPAPKFSGFSLFQNWLSIPVMEKLRSFVGTAKRIMLRKYYKKRDAELKDTI